MAETQTSCKTPFSKEICQKTLPHIGTKYEFTPRKHFYNGWHLPVKT